MCKILGTLILFLSLSYSNITLAAEQNSKLLGTFIDDNEVNTVEKQFALLISVLANIALYFEEAHSAVVTEQNIYGHGTPIFEIIRKPIAGLELQKIYACAQEAGHQNIFGLLDCDFNLASVRWGAQAAAKKAINKAKADGLSKNEISKAAHRAVKIWTFNYIMENFNGILTPSYTRVLAHVTPEMTLNFYSQFIALEQQIFADLSAEDREFLEATFAVLHERLIIFPNQASSFIFVMHQMHMPFDISRYIFLYLGLLYGYNHF